MRSSNKKDAKPQKNWAFFNSTAQWAIVANQTFQNSGLGGRMTCSGKYPVQVEFCSILNTSTGTSAWLTLTVYMDGANICTTAGFAKSMFHSYPMPGGGGWTTGWASKIIYPSAGSHLFEVWGMCGTGSGNGFVNFSTYPFNLFVREL